MRLLLKIPIWFLVTGLIMAVLLRLMVVYPINALAYSNVLHGHSHIMFIGWVFNALYLGFVHAFIRQEAKKKYVRLFIITLFPTVGMMISFPIQGYGLYSIIFSSLHTLLGLVFLILFLRDTKRCAGISVWFARTSLVFMGISAFGPLGLALIKSNGLANTQWYTYSIYYYLHFQYNGFFMFGIAGLLLSQVESKIGVFAPHVRRAGHWLAFLTVPTFLLSILYSSPAAPFNIIGGVAAFLQFVFFIKVALIFWRVPLDPARINGSFLIRLFFIAVALKFFLQLVSALPAAAQLAFELRPLVIAYLHLVLVGGITFGLFAWFLIARHMSIRAIPPLRMFVLLFLIMEVVLVAMPWWSLTFPAAAHVLLVLSVLQLISGAWIAIEHRPVLPSSVYECIRKIEEGSARKMPI